MIISRKWLNSYLEPNLNDIDDKAFAARMTMTGSKVESIERFGDDISGVYIAKILSIKPHENADTLSVLEVSAGDKGVFNIVSGAPNLEPGALCLLGAPGAKIGKGQLIEAKSFRGVLSEGMLLSAAELGLTSHELPGAHPDGIYIVKDENLSEGMPLSALFDMSDSVFEFEITPNRPDCLSYIGLAREAAASFDRELKIAQPKDRPLAGANTVLPTIKIEDPKLCLRYMGGMVKNVKIEPSPKWLRERLHFSGVRPINNIVDITNYVMLEYGQPMHAFDFGTINGGITVRLPREGETITSLDGNVRDIDSDALLICDDSRPIGIAGVMGGEGSEITADTKHVFFESANFDSSSIRKTAQKLNMRTESSSRFSKGIDPELCRAGLLKALQLVEELGAGEVVNEICDEYPGKKEPLYLPFEPEKINKVIGSSLDAEFMLKTLEKLGFSYDGKLIRVPSWREDLDPDYPANHLGEEVCRIYGYDVLAPKDSGGSGEIAGKYTDFQKVQIKLSEVARAAGYYEIVTYSFFSPGNFDLINLAEDSVKRDGIVILNPLGEDTSMMRTTTLPAMLETLARNQNYKNKNARLFDFGRIYLKREDDVLADERPFLTLGAYGDMDFFELKGHIEAMLKGLRIENYSFIRDDGEGAYHPGRAAAVYIGDEKIGIMGEIHPVCVKNYSLSGAVFAAELDMLKLTEHLGKTPEYKPLALFPATLRDISLVLDKEISAGDLREKILKFGGELLESAEVFDVYEGAGIAEGKKAIALSLSFRSESETLRDADVDELIEKILEGVEKELGARLR